MKVRQLMEALSQLENKRNAQEHTDNREPYNMFMAKISKFWQEMPASKKAEIEENNKQWYSKEAVEERTYSYFDKVFADKAQSQQETLEDRREKANKTCLGFANIFGHTTVKSLPLFQQQTLVIMCALHLGVIPNNCWFNMEKGVFVSGAPQIGKTSVFVYLKSLPWFKYRIVTSYQLHDIAENGGAGALDIFKKGKTLVIDEIGWEPVANHFGNKIDAVEVVLHARHARGLITHITSNMSIEALEQRYNPHIVARIRKASNIITTEGAKQFIEN